MQIVWDEPKRLTNLAKHGYDFADLTQDFFVAATVVPVRSGRFKAIGTLDSAMLAIIFVFLGREGVSVISMRSASTSERRQYEDKTLPRSH
jgi:uncharacterized DUF497 family protein